MPYRRSRITDGMVICSVHRIRQPQECCVSILRFGYRPEWCGMCNTNHDYIALRVEVRSEDILFGGMPGNDAKVRVRRLTVLD